MGPFFISEISFKTQSPLPPPIPTPPTPQPPPGASLLRESEQEAHQVNRHFRAAAEKAMWLSDEWLWVQGRVRGDRRTPRGRQNHGPTHYPVAGVADPETDRTWDCPRDGIVHQVTLLGTLKLQV